MLRPSSPPPRGHVSPANRPCWSRAGAVLGRGGMWSTGVSEASPSLWTWFHFMAVCPPGVIEKETFWLESPSFMTVVWLLIIICFGLFGLYLILLDFYFFCFFLVGLGVVLEMNCREEWSESINLNHRTVNDWFGFGGDPILSMGIIAISVAFDGNVGFAFSILLQFPKNGRFTRHADILAENLWSAVNREIVRRPERASFHPRAFLSTASSAAPWRPRTAGAAAAAARATRSLFSRRLLLLLLLLLLPTRWLGATTESLQVNRWIVTHNAFKQKHKEEEPEEEEEEEEEEEQTFEKE